jgi:hypothetical protein
VRIAKYPIVSKAILLVAVIALPAAERELGGAGPEGGRAAQRPTAAEAQGRAELLHETLHATLQVVHHQYYREDEGLAIPAATLKKVFGELASRKQVDVRWLVVNAAAMNSDHLPQNDFERKAVAAIGAGKDEYVEVEQDVFRRAAPITLSSECLKCHAPRRSSTNDRLAGLIISMPIRRTEAAAGAGR